MKTRFSHIALLLLGIFAVTLIPFNVLHHHSEDEHAEAILLHQLSEHHCELDDQFCQPALDAHCGHDTHMAKPVGKCFSCTFHFVKQIEATVFETTHFIDAKQRVYAEYESFRISNAFIQLSNKGPPEV